MPPRKPRTQTVVASSDDGFKKAIDALAKSFLTGNAAISPQRAPSGGSIGNLAGSIPADLLRQVSSNLGASFGKTSEEVELALAESGLSWGPPFPPGRPLDPFWGYRRPPRRYDYAVGENVQIVPRWNRISFKTLENLFKSYYAFQIAVRHVINDVRSLDYEIVPPPHTIEDVRPDLLAAQDFIDLPDGQQPFREWLGQFLQDVLRYDAGALYIRRNRENKPIALEVMSGPTLIPLIDFYGRSPTDNNIPQDGPGTAWPDTITPAFVQIIEGMPWVWLTQDDVIYQPLNPLPESQYGLAPMEAVLMQANTDLRFQWFLLQHFTEGTVPAGFMEAPPDLSNPKQVEMWQETWDAVMMGDQSKLSQIRWVPAGSKFTPIKDEKFDKDQTLYLLRCTAAAFGVTPNDLGFTEDVNRSTGEIQVDVQFRVGTLPVVRYVEDIINFFFKQHLKLKACIQFDTGQGSMHRLEAAQANDFYIRNGTLSPDEVRKSLGLQVDIRKPIPRFVENNKVGPIPLSRIVDIAGKINPTTYASTDTPNNLPTPYTPATGSTTDIAPPPVQNGQLKPPEANAPSVANTPSKPKAKPKAKQPAVKKPVDKKVLKKMLTEVVGELLKDGRVSGVDNTGGPGVTRGYMNPLSLNGDGPDAELAEAEESFRPQPLDLPEDEDEAANLATKMIRQWRENSINRVKRGQSPKMFVGLPEPIQKSIWSKLQNATTVPEVVEVFYNPLESFELKKKLSREVAGLLVQAANTKRVLLIQRKPDKADDDDSYARWEAPGGHLDGGIDGGQDESVFAGALREWEEETGATLPPIGDGAELVGGWVSDNGDYEGIIVRVPTEESVVFHDNHDNHEVSNVKWCDPSFLTNHQVRDKLSEQAPLIMPALKSRHERFHIHTNKIVEHYRDAIQNDMRQILAGDTAERALNAAYVNFQKLLAVPNANGTTNVAPYKQQLSTLLGNAAVPAVGAAVAGAAPLAAGGALVGLGGAIGAASAILGAAVLEVGTLKATLRLLYKTAVLQGVHEAQQELGKSSDLLPNLPPDYWESWQPGFEEAINELSYQQPIEQLLSTIDTRAQGMADTEVKRILAAIETGLKNGETKEQVEARINEIINDPNRAHLIAETEYSYAATAARRMVYRQNNVQKVAWVHDLGACAACLQNAKASPISINQSWPSGNAPVHPACRCVEVPDE